MYFWRGRKISGVKQKPPVLLLVRCFPQRLRDAGVCLRWGHGHGGHTSRRCWSTPDPSFGARSAIIKVANATPPHPHPTSQMTDRHPPWQETARRAARVHYSCGLEIGQLQTAQEKLLRVWNTLPLPTQLAGCRSPHGALFHFVSIHLSGFGAPALIPLFSSCVSHWIIPYAASHLLTCVFQLCVYLFFFSLSLWIYRCQRV